MSNTRFVYMALKTIRFVIRTDSPIRLNKSIRMDSLWKISPIRDWPTPRKGQNPFAEGGTPYTTFEGHVTLNEDEYNESVRLKFRHCLGVS